MIFLKPSNNKIDYLINCADVNCEVNFVHWLLYESVFNNEFINAKNKKEIIFQVTF